MAEQRTNSFTSFILSEGELEQAVKLNPLQEMYLQNLHVETAELLLSIKFAPDRIHEFTQQEAYYRGQMELIGFLLVQDKTIKLRDETRRREELKAAAEIQQTTDGA